MNLQETQKIVEAIQELNKTLENLCGSLDLEKRVSELEKVVTEVSAYYNCGGYHD